jgi:hypothetical protein
MCTRALGPGLCRFLDMDFREFLPRTPVNKENKDRDGMPRPSLRTARFLRARPALDRWARAAAETQCRIRGRRPPFARNPAARRAPAGWSGRRSARPR